jgi:hypothetical protein
MNSAKRISFAGVGLIAALSCADLVIAQEPIAAPPAGDVVAAPALIATPTQAAAAAEPSPAEIRRNPFGSKPIASSALAARRGGDDRVFNDNKLKGVVADNKASNLTTGMNVLSEGAFAGSSGLSTVIQNSGNNVLIQNATIVNVQVK